MSRPRQRARRDERRRERSGVVLDHAPCGTSARAESRLLLAGRAPIRVSSTRRFVMRCFRPITVQVSGEVPHPLCQPARSSTAAGERWKEPRGVETRGRNWRGQALLGRGAPRWRNSLQYGRWRWRCVMYWGARQSSCCLYPSSLSSCGCVVFSLLSVVAFLSLLFMLPPPGWCSPAVE